MILPHVDITKNIRVCDINTHARVHVWNNPDKSDVGYKRGRSS